MTPADLYRVKAGDMIALARAETDPFQKAEYERLSLAYLRLADQAVRNSQTDGVRYGPMIDRPSTDQPAGQPERQQQQQTQPQTKPKSDS